MTTLQQRRAKNALDRIMELKDKHHDFKKLYRSYVDSLGPAILMNGLGQALATERAAAGTRQEGNKEEGDGKGAHRKKAHGEVYDSIERWLCRKDDGVYPGSKDLLSAIMGHGQSRYLRAQGEALAWLEWHKKFCRAYLPDDDGGGE